MLRKSRTASDLITKVNMTPLIDVALVLVIILLVTAPMLSVADLQVDLPAAHSRGVEEERNVSVTLGVHGELAVDRHVVTTETLRAVLHEHLSQPGNQDVLVVVRADAGTPYSAVGHVLEEVRAAGATRLAIATRQTFEPDSEANGDADADAAPPRPGGGR